MNQSFRILIAAAVAILVNFGSEFAFADRGHGPRAEAKATSRYEVNFKGQPVAKLQQAARLFAGLGLDVAGVDFGDRTVELILTDDEARTLRAKFKLQPVLVQSEAESPDPRYLNPERVAQKLAELAARYPRFAKLHEIGRSVEGRPILALELSTPDPVLKPAVLFDGMHHAREIMTPEIVVDIAETLLQNASERRRIRPGHEGMDQLSRVRVWVVPQVNPDGNNIVWTMNPWWRKNAFRDRGQVTGVDLNRNYSFQWGKCRGSSDRPPSDTFRGPSASSEPETVAVTNLADRIRPIGYLSYHSFGEMVLAPFGCQGQFTSEHELLVRIGKQLAQALPTDNNRGTYSFGTSWQLLYPNDGTSKDHIFAQFGAPSFTIEVNTSFHPDYSLREPTLKKHREGWTLFIDQLMKNLLTVRVKDANGRPVRARVEFSGIVHKAGERVFTTDSTGVFFKVLPPGPTVVRITAAGGGRREVPVTMTGEPQVLEITF